MRKLVSYASAESQLKLDWRIICHGWNQKFLGQTTRKTCLSFSIVHPMQFIGALLVDRFNMLHCSQGQPCDSASSILWWGRESETSTNRPPMAMCTPMYWSRPPDLNVPCTIDHGVNPGRWRRYGHKYIGMDLHGTSIIKTSHLTIMGGFLEGAAMSWAVLWGSGFTTPFLVSSWLCSSSI